MRSLCTLGSIATLLLFTSPSRADKPRPALAFLAGASTFLAGFVVGGVVAATSNGSDAQENAGWLTMQVGFALAPLASHAVEEEWMRALVFSSPPAALVGASATLLAVRPATIEHGELADQRVIWSLFGAGVLTSLVGVVDAAFADQRAGARAPAPSASGCSHFAVAVAPAFGSGQVGLTIGGSL